MRLQYLFHPLAATELDEAVEYYENRRTGKGLELLAAFEKAINQVCEFPDAAPCTRGKIRSKLLTPLRRWHYSIHYRVSGGTARILAFAHHKRQPFYGLGRK